MLWAEASLAQESLILPGSARAIGGQMRVPSGPVRRRCCGPHNRSSTMDTKGNLSRWRAAAWAMAQGQFQHLPEWYTLRHYSNAKNAARAIPIVLIALGEPVRPGLLVSRFRRLYHFAARSRTNVGTKGTLGPVLN